MKEITVHDKTFVKYIDSIEIADRVKIIGRDLSLRFAGKKVVVLGVLNGAFVFMADLVRYCDFETECRFIKIKSYHGMQSTGNVIIENPEILSIEDEHVIIIEDIVDSGLTMKIFMAQLKDKRPASISLVTLLHKPASMVHDIKIDEIGFSIPPLFVIGYGLDYEGIGRNLPHIYQLKN